MGVFDATVEIESAIKANFAAELDAVAAARGKTLDNTFTFYLRERAETFARKTLPGVGLWVSGVQTGAKRSGRRDWLIDVTIDYLDSGTDRILLGERVELSLEAMMRVIDNLATTGTLLGAGESEFQTAIIHDIGDLLQEAQSGPFISGFRIQLPVRQRDEL